MDETVALKRADVLFF